MAMIEIGGYSLQPAHITIIEPFNGNHGTDTGTVRFHVSGGHTAVFSGTTSECATKRAEVVAAINAL